MKTLKKIGAIALLLILVGSAFISVFAVAKTGITIAIIGNIILLAFATPAIVRLFNYIRDKQDFPLEIGAFFALFLVIIGAITSLVLTAQQSLWVAFAGQLCVIAGAVPSIVRLFNYIRDKQDFPLEIGEEFTTDKGEHLRVIGFEEDGTPKCERVKE